jgi:hypothetical protein
MKSPVGWFIRLPSTIRALTDNPQLRRLELTSLLWNAGEQVYVVGLLVYAFAAAGTAGVAIVGVLQAVPSIAFLPPLLRATTRQPPAQVLRILLGLRFASVGLAAIAIGSAAPTPLVFTLAAIDGVLATAARPTRGTLVPQVARSPEELIAANVSISTGRSVASLIGPALAALFLSVRDVTSTFAVGAGVLGVAFALSLAIHAPPSLLSARRSSEQRGGVRALLRLRYPRWILGVVLVQQLVRGMLPVLLVSFALQQLAAGQETVGVLNSAIGLGGLVGGTLSIVALRRLRLATALGIAFVLWGVGILGSGLVATLAAAIAFLVVGGIGKGGIEVASVTLLQRTVPVVYRSAVFGVIELTVSAAVAVGAVLGALLVGLFGPGQALVIAGALTLVLAGLSWPVLRSADEGAIVPEREIRMLRGVPMLGPLTMCTKEELAGNLRRVSVPAGHVIIRQGEVGDAFYILESGAMEAIVDEGPGRPLVPGDSFGEIALLRDIPRTATVRAMKPSTVLALDREHFLAAVTGRRDAITAAEEVIRDRLG